MPNIRQFWMPLSTINQPTRLEPEMRYDKGLNYQRDHNRLNENEIANMYN